MNHCCTKKAIILIQILCFQICPELYKLLSERIAQSNDGYVFYDVGATKASDSLRKVMIANIPEKYKENRYCFHSWRHFYNTYLLSNDINPIKVAAVLGHLKSVINLS